MSTDQPRIFYVYKNTTGVRADPIPEAWYFRGAKPLGVGSARPFELPPSAAMSAAAGMPATAARVPAAEARASA